MLDLGADPVSARPLGLGRLLLVVSASGFAAWFAYVTFVPLVPYKPICGIGRNAVGLEGPLRAEFVEQLVVALAEEGFRFRRAGEVVQVPHADIWPNRGTLSRPGHAMSRSFASFQAKLDATLATNIAQGRLWLGNAPRRPGRDITVPPPLQAHLDRLQAQYGPLPARSSDTDWPWFDLFTTDCALLRAALIRVEDLPDAAAAR